MACWFRRPGFAPSCLALDRSVRMSTLLDVLLRASSQTLPQAVERTFDSLHSRTALIPPPQARRASCRLASPSRSPVGGGTPHCHRRWLRLGAASCGPSPSPLPLSSFRTRRRAGASLILAPELRRLILGPHALPRVRPLGMRVRRDSADTFRAHNVQEHHNPPCSTADTPRTSHTEGGSPRSDGNECGHRPPHKAHTTPVRRATVRP